LNKKRAKNRGRQEVKGKKINRPISLEKEGSERKVLKNYSFFGSFPQKNERCHQKEVICFDT